MVPLLMLLMRLSKLANTALECLGKFAECVIECFGLEYSCPPMAEVLEKILEENESRGFLVLTLFFDTCQGR